MSVEQHKISEARAAAADLADRARFELRDYREVKGQYDRIVSVGMFEHVGKKNYDEFFTKINHLLTEDGIALLHAIGFSDPPGRTPPDRSATVKETDALGCGRSDAPVGAVRL